jgi:hypothetical protein
MVLSKEGEEHHCSCSFFCPVQERDIIYGKCRKHKQYTIFTQTPFVCVGTTKEDILYFFGKNLKHHKPGMRAVAWSQKKCEKLYDALLDIGKDKSVPTFLSHMYELWTHRKDERLISATAEYVDMDAGSLLRLLVKWHTQFDKRRLWLLGINNKEITELLRITKNFDTLYTIALKNPMRLYPLTIEKGMSILHRFGKRPSSHQMLCGKIVRKVYENATQKEWTSTPEKFLVREFANYPSLKEELARDYSLVYDYHSAYLKHNHTVETQVFEALKARHLAKPLECFEDLELRDDPSVPLSPDQEKAIKGALKHRLSFICGQPGTGKTTIIREMVHYLEQEDIPYHIAAFTGKAVARLREVLKSMIPKTLHLTIKKAELVQFGHLIIDEASMVTTELFWDFLNIFSKFFSITFVGDPNQLPPIGWGSLFQNALESGRFPTYELVKNHRVYEVEGEVDGILFNTRKIIAPRAKNDTRLPKFKTTDNFILTKGGLNEVLAFAQAFRDQDVAANDITVITPYNRDLEIINAHFQQLYYKDLESTNLSSSEENKSSESSEDDEVSFQKVDWVMDQRENVWHLQDRVMMKQNDYDINVMNGEEGFVSEVHPKYIKVDFGPGREHEFPLEPPSRPKKNYYSKVHEEDQRTVRWLTLSYGITVHKSQGSEWEYVIFYLPEGKKHSKSYLHKNLIYTGLTRAKRALFFIGEIQELKKACIRPMPYRYEHLSQRIQEGVEVWNVKDDDEEENRIDEDTYNEMREQMLV